MTGESDHLHQIEQVSLVNRSKDNPQNWGAILDFTKTTVIYL